MIGADFAVFRILLKASFRGNRAACVKVAALRRVQGAGNVTFQDNALAIAGFVRVRDRYRGHQRAGVRVERVQIDFIPIRQLHHLTEIHYDHPVADVPHHA